MFEKKVFSTCKVCLVLLLSIKLNVEAWSPHSLNNQRTFPMTSSSLRMGLFDGWNAGGSNRGRLDDEWEKQQELLKLRRASKSDRDKYFYDVSSYYVMKLFIMLKRFR